jgi:hypothetical protein
MSSQTVLLLIIIFAIKHFIVDFIAQTKWQYTNKHILFHLGGIFHSWLHGITTLIILDAFHFRIPIYILFNIAITEWVIHYFIDYFKMNIALYFNWKCNESYKFWWLLGFDQLLHYLTYCGIVYYLLSIL